MVAVFRVVHPDGTTCAEYVVTPSPVKAAEHRAVAHAIRIGGRVFLSDEDGYLSLVFAARGRNARPAAA